MSGSDKIFSINLVELILENRLLNAFKICLKSALQKLNVLSSLLFTIETCLNQRMFNNNA